MASDTVALSAVARQGVLTLNKSTALSSRTQDLPPSGMRPGDVQTTNLHVRASELAGLKDSVSQAIGTVKAALIGIDTINSTVWRMKELATEAKSTPDTTARARLAAEFDALRTRVSSLAENASHQGVALIGNAAGSLTVDLGETHKLVVAGTALDDKGLGLVPAVTGWETDEALDQAAASIDDALAVLQSTAQTLGRSVTTLTVRLDFMKELINTLAEGELKLVDPDMNEEAAGLLALQTRQQLSTISLSLAQRSEGSMLSLF